MDKDEKTIYCVGCREKTTYTDPEYMASQWESPINKIPVMRHQIKATCTKCHRRCSRFMPYEKEGPQ